MEEFIRAFESAKMAIIGTTNLALESLDKAAKQAIAEYKSMQQRLAELEKKKKNNLSNNIANKRDPSGSLFYGGKNMKKLLVIVVLIAVSSLSFANIIEFFESIPPVIKFSVGAGIALYELVVGLSVGIRPHCGDMGHRLWGVLLRAFHRYGYLPVERRAQALEI